MSPNVAVSWTLDADDQIHVGIREFGIRRMAAVVGVSPQTVANWVSGTPMPDSAMLVVCETLGLESPLVRARDVKARPGLRHTRVDFHDGVVRKLGRLRGRRVYGEPRRLAQIRSDGTVTAGGIE